MSNPAQAFRDMAFRIENIEPAEFAGAVVVFPPGEAEPIAFLLTDPKPDILQFMSGVKSRVEIVTAELMEQARNRNSGWSR